MRPTRSIENNLNFARKTAEYEIKAKSIWPVKIVSSKFSFSVWAPSAPYRYSQMGEVRVIWTTYL